MSKSVFLKPSPGFGTAFVYAWRGIKSTVTFKLNVTPRQKKSYVAFLPERLLVQDQKNCFILLSVYLRNGCYQ